MFASELKELTIHHAQFIHAKWPLNQKPIRDISSYRVYKKIVPQSPNKVWYLPCAYLFGCFSYQFIEKYSAKIWKHVVIIIKLCTFVALCFVQERFLCNVLALAHSPNNSTYCSLRIVPKLNRPPIYICTPFLHTEWSLEVALLEWSCLM